MSNNHNEKKIIEISLQEFVNRFRDGLNNKKRFIFFLGAGCSKSSGIPTANELARKWVKKLCNHRGKNIYQCIKENNNSEFLNEEKNEDIISEKEIWYKEDEVCIKCLKKEFPEFEKDFVLIYSDVIKKVFPNALDRQKEIEDITTGKYPGFGYSVLAKLVNHQDYGFNCNIIMTTNFDDLIADALYIYTSKRPLIIIPQQSLLRWASVGENRALVLKLHGDGKYAAINTDEDIGDNKEKEKLINQLAKVFNHYLFDSNLVFVGYGGNDETIKEALNRIELDVKNRLGVYWINNILPNNEFGNWLRDIDAIHVNHLDFDELMFRILVDLDINLPNDSKIKRMGENYFKAIKNYYIHLIKYQQDENLEKEFVNIIRKTADKLKCNLEIEKTILCGGSMYDIEEKYTSQMKEYRNNPDFLGKYAFFLHEYKKEMDNAEKFYQEALKVDNFHATNTGNYAYFLHKYCKKTSEASKYYKKAIDLDENHEINLQRYAEFLHKIEKKYLKASRIYRQAIRLNPENVKTLSNYALFLQEVEKSYKKAEELYKKGIILDPDCSTNLSNYAFFLHTIRKAKREAEYYYEKAMSKSNDNNIDVLARYAFYLHDIKGDRIEALKLYERVLEKDRMHMDVLLNLALLLHEEGRYDEAQNLYREASKIDKHSPILHIRWGCLLYDAFDKFISAERKFKRALKIDDENTTVLLEYCNFLKAKRERAIEQNNSNELEKLDELLDKFYEKLKEIDIEDEQIFQDYTMHFYERDPERIKKLRHIQYKNI